MIKMKKSLKILATSIVCSAVVVLPVVAIKNSITSSTLFSVNKIGIYVEKQWRPAYELAIKLYNEQFPDRKYDIQILELGAFSANDLVDTLGYADQKVADLIYTPVDRIPNLVQNNGAIMGFDSPEELISQEFSKEIYQGSDIATFAKKGEALVIPPNSKDSYPKPFYFGVPHSTEALILYYKGFGTDELNSIDSIVQYVNNNKWTDSMYSFAFNNLWYSLGLIAGFIEQQMPGAGKNGQLVGKSLVSMTTKDTKFQSNIINIDGQKEILEDLINTPGWNKNGVSAPIDSITQALKNTINWVANFYASSKVENKALSSNGNDWLLDGNFAPNTEKLLQNDNIKKAATIDGPWMVSSYKKYFDKAIAVPQITSGAPYLQAPGGWLYCINQRNATNSTKLRDIKRFLNILLTNDEVIKAQYTYAGKIIEGTHAKNLLSKMADENIKTPGKELESAVIKAVFESQTMDQRPDGGNAEFGQVWASWNENGITSATNIPNYSYSPKDILVSWSTRNVAIADVQAALRKQLIISFTTMLTGLRGRK